MDSGVSTMPAVLRKFLPPDPDPLCTARQRGGPRSQEKTPQEETGNRRRPFPLHSVRREDDRPSPASRNPLSLLQLLENQGAPEGRQGPRHPQGEGGKEKGNEGKDVPELSWRRKSCRWRLREFPGTMHRPKVTSFLLHISLHSLFLCFKRASSQSTPVCQLYKCWVSVLCGIPKVIAVLGS